MLLIVIIKVFINYSIKILVILDLSYAIYVLIIFNIYFVLFLWWDLSLVKQELFNENLESFTYFKQGNKNLIILSSTCLYVDI